MNKGDWDIIVMLLVMLLVVVVVAFAFAFMNQPCEPPACPVCKQCVPTEGYDNRIQELEAENEFMTTEYELMLKEKTLYEAELEGKTTHPLYYPYSRHQSELDALWKIYQENEVEQYLKTNYIVDLNETTDCADNGSYSMHSVIGCLVDRVHEQLTYKQNGVYAPASTAWKKGKGDCSEYSAAFCSLARANNIPCRIVYGKSIHSNSTHVWAEVMLVNGYGWAWQIIEPTERTDGEQPDYIAAPDEYIKYTEYAW